MLNIRDLKEFITGSAQPKLNQANLNSMSIAVPQLERQKQFASLCEHHLSICNQQRLASDTAQATFDALLAQSFAPPTAQQAAA